MAQRLFRTVVFTMLTIALLAPSPSRAGDQSELRPTIAFVSTRDTPGATVIQLGNAVEIYLMNPTADPAQQDPRRLTNNEVGEAFPVLSPNGKQIVFDSNRLRAGGEPLNTSDLFVMNTDGTEQTFLTRGSSASWSADGKHVVFHASASGTGQPIRTDPGAPTSDSDIFVTNVDDCLEDVVACNDVNQPIKRNLTKNGDATVDDDPDWSPDGQQIVFTRHDKGDNPINSTSAEIYVINADGTGLTQLTFNGQEERAPAWSPDGTRILFACHPEQGGPFEICVMNADGTGRIKLTATGVFHGTPQWSPDGTMITFHKNVLTNNVRTRELWTLKVVNPAVETQLTDATDPPGTINGINHEANWGVVRIPPGQVNSQVAAGSNHRSADTARGPAVDDGTDRDRKADHGKQGKANKGKKDNDKKDKKGKKGKGSGGKRHR